MGSRRTQTDDEDAKTSALAPNREQLWSGNGAKADTDRTKRPYASMRWVVRFVRFTTNKYKRTIWDRNGPCGEVGPLGLVTSGQKATAGTPLLPDRYTHKVSLTI